LPEAKPKPAMRANSAALTCEAAVARDAGTEQRSRSRRVAAQQVEDEALEVAGLADVHRRARGLEGLGLPRTR
jgi:hypothetical protein